MKPRLPRRHNNDAAKSRVRRALGQWIRRRKHLWPLYDSPFRYVTSPLRALPDWYIIGAPKCATTSLYEYIIMHPDISPCLRGKEPMFYFAWWEYGESYYRSFFPIRRRGCITGEATPSYLAHPLPIAKRMHEMTPHAKIIVMLRDPTDRAYSHYWFMRRSGEETEPTFEAALERETKRHDEYLRGDMTEHPWHMYRGQGEYARHLERWNEYFPVDKMLVVNFDDFAADPQAVLVKVWDHLGVRRVSVPTLPPQNVGAYLPRSSES